MFKLTHDGGFRQEVRPGLITGPGLKSLDGDQHVLPLLLGQLSSADISELSPTNDRLYRDVSRILKERHSISELS